MLAYTLLLTFLVITVSRTGAEDLYTKPFPDEFLFGVATSAYQIEGAWNESGKGENIWDYLTHSKPEYISDGSNGDVACDSYHRTEDDVELIADLGVDYYRFSLSWSRILSTGFYPDINQDGIRYYNELINTLLSKNIEPMITLYHWDLPRSIHAMGGWANEAIVDYFEDYARVAFDNFGDRVKFWITINEPVTICYEGYGASLKAPAVNSTGIGNYLCMHNLLKAHARVYHVYDSEYRSTQEGNISITLDNAWLEPASDSQEDVAAAERARQFTIGWMANAIFGSGDYPSVMKEFVANRSRNEGFLQSRLPEFTAEQVEYIKGTSDYYCVNHYSTRYVEDISDVSYGTPHYYKDMRVRVFADDSWSSGASEWLKVVPWGFRKLLKWIHEQYNTTILVTENGYSDHGELDDEDRIVYIQLYLSELLKAVHEDGVDVKAYTFWSLMDNFEWFEGYEASFGLYSVDFSDPSLPRTAKTSVDEVKQIISDRRLPSETYNSTVSSLGWSAATSILMCASHVILNS